MRTPGTKTKLAFLGVAAALALLGAALLVAAPRMAHGPRISVLFIGNSFTSVNDLPGTVAGIARSLGGRVDYDVAAIGGYKLLQHAQDPATLAKIRSRPWDFVVLQEQSQIPSFPAEQVAKEVEPYVRQLDRIIHDAHPSSKTVFYETWGYKSGDGQNCAADPGVCTYAGMQTRLTAAYAHLASMTSGGLAPVGEAWSRVRSSHPEIELYQNDGTHPSPDGTYLAACVFYATLFRHPVVGAAPLLGLEPLRARTLQEVAQETALAPEK